MILQFITKEDLIERANNLLFFNTDLKEVQTVDEYLGKSRGGIFEWIRMQNQKDAEANLIYKIKLVKAVADKNGDVALDAYLDITQKPDVNHPLYAKFQMFKAMGCDLNDCFIPMKKEDFEIYLEIYNTVFKK